MGKLPDIVLQVVWHKCLCLEGIKGGQLSSSLLPACIWDVDSKDAMGS